MGSRSACLGARILEGIERLSYGSSGFFPRVILPPDLAAAREKDADSNDSIEVWLSKYTISV